MVRRNWRLILLAVLFAAPFLFLIGYGSYELWWTGWSFWAWWVMFACLATAYFLALRWQRQLKLLGPVEFTAPLHWTDRDKQAWQLVEARAKAGARIEPDKFSSITFYAETAQEMALELARFYHPRAQDPVGSLTIPEILAVIELAAHDLAEMVDKYLPGGHLLTVRDWQKAKKATEWYQTASNVYWAIATLFAPFNTGIRYLASRVGMSTPLQKLQENLILWFYTAFVHRLGTYLIDLNSGRLRVGARRYRELMQRHGSAALERDETAPSADGSEEVRQVTFTVIGQVKAGKSSLINALLGERRAATNVLPQTSEITRYDLKLPDIPTRLSILDTVGYGHAGPKKDQLRATQEAARQSEVLLLVMQARNPARQADLEMIQALRKWFEEHPELKMPPVLGVVTHIDLLSPAMEWAPPYDWQNPKRTKEQQISEALEVVREQLGQYLVGVVPVCTAEGKVYGVDEWLLPALTEMLDQAHAVAFLRCLKAEADTGRVWRVFEQLLAAGKEILRVVWQPPPK